MDKRKRREETNTTTTPVMQLSNNWAFFEAEFPDSSELHLIPIEDSYPHVIDLKGTCSCRPALDPECEIISWVHNAWDLRDLYESNQLKLN